MLQQSGLLLLSSFIVLTLFGIAEIYNKNFIKSTKIYGIIQINEKNLKINVFAALFFLPLSANARVENGYADVLLETFK